MMAAASTPARVAGLACVVVVVCVTGVAAGPVTSKPCEPDSGAGINTVTTLPRRDWKFKSRSADLGDGSYHVWDCPDDGELGTCSLVDDLKIKDIASPPEDDSVLYYLQSVAMYAAIAVLAFLVTLVAPFVFCCCRCSSCTRCCKRSCCCGCGKRWPTRKTCLLGYTDRVGPSKHFPFAYSRSQAWVVRGCFLVFALLVIIFVCLGEFKGNRAVAPALDSLADSPAGAAQLVMRSTTPFANLVVNAIGTVIQTVGRGLVDVILDAIDFREVRVRVLCVQDSLDTVPRPAQLTDVTEEAIDLVQQATNVVASAVPALLDLENVLDSTGDVADGGLDIVSDLASSTATVVSASATVQQELDDLLALNTTLSSQSSDVYLPQMADDVDILTDDSSYPSDGTVNAAVSGLGSFLNGDMDGQSGTQGALAGQLSAMVPTLTALPSGVDTAASLDALDTLVASTSLNSTIDSITALDDAVATVPTVASAQDVIDDLSATFDALDVNPFLAVIDEVETLANTTVLTKLSLLLDSVADLAGIIPCLVDMVSMVDDIDAKLLSLPSSFRTVDDVLDDVNTTVTDGISSVRDFQGDLASVQEDLDTFDPQEFWDVRDLLHDLRVRVNDATTVMADLNSTLLDYADTEADLDLSDTLSSVHDIEARLRDPDLRVPPALVSALQTVGTSVSSITTRLQQSSSAIAAFQGSECVQDTGCGSCSTTGDPCPVDAADLPGCCTVSLDTALLNATRTDLAAFSGLRQALTAIDASPLTGSIRSLSNAVTDLPNVVDDDSEVQRLLASVNDLPLDSAEADLQKVLDELSSSGRGQLGSVRSTLSDVSTALDDVPTPNSMREDLEKLTEPLDKTLSEGTEQISDFLWYLDQAIDILYNDLDSYFDRMAVPSLQNALDVGGVAGLMRHLLNLGQDMLARFNTAQNTTSFDVDLLEEAKDALRPADVLSSHADTTNGPIYFFFRLFDVDTVMPPDDNGYIFRDINDDKYPDDLQCVTTACVRRTVQRWNTGTLREASDGSVPVDMSREGLVSVLYCIPILIVLIGTVGAVSFCGKESTWQYWPACVSTTCMFIMMPFVFLFAGAVTFPMVMVSGDFCLSGPNLGYQYLSGSLLDVCDTFGGKPTGQGSMCHFSYDVGLNSRTIEFDVDIPAVYSTLLGSCPPASEGPLAGLFDSLRSNVEDLALEETHEHLDKRAGKDWDPREPVRDVLITGATNVGTTATSFIDDMEELWACDGINTAIGTAKDSLCCDMLSAWYWLVASWYLVGWAMLLCGCTAGIMGCKRFPTAVWGYAAKEEQKKLEASQRQPSSRFTDNPILQPVVDTSPTYVPPSVPQASGAVEMAPSTKRIHGVTYVAHTDVSAPVVTGTPTTDWAAPRAAFAPRPTR